MINKHFLKTLLMFTGMILIGLLGIFLVSNYANDEVNSTSELNVAK